MQLVVGSQGGGNARVHMSSWQSDAVTPVLLYHTWLLRDRKKEIKSHVTFSPFVCRSRQPLETD